MAKAQLLIDDYKQTVVTLPTDKIVTFTLAMKPGKTKLTANLLDKEDKVICGAIYVWVTRFK